MSEQSGKAKIAEGLRQVKQAETQNTLGRQKLEVFEEQKSQVVEAIQLVLGFFKSLQTPAHEARTLFEAASTNYTEGSRQIAEALLGVENDSLTNAAGNLLRVASNYRGDTPGEVPNLSGAIDRGAPDITRNLLIIEDRAANILASLQVLARHTAEAHNVAAPAISVIEDYYNDLRAD
jgi:hypothetical protein